MKYIKAYEGEYDGSQGTRYCWLIPTDERWIDSIDKISKLDIDIRYVNDLEFLKGVSEEKRIRKDYDFVYIIYSSNQYPHWDWVKYDDNALTFFKKAKIKFMGNINISDDEIELKTDIKKYNI